MLDEDPHDTEPDSIKKIGIAQTVVGGKTVYEA
jgi:predicted amidohydrolase YtcJ